MRSTDLGPDYEALAHLVVEACDGAIDGIFLYAELESGVVAPALFQDVGDQINYREPDHDIMDQLEKIWEKLDQEDQWRVIQCQVTKGRFDARFEFPDEIDEKEDEVEGLLRALKSVFGDKPIVYLDT